MKTLHAVTKRLSPKAAKPFRAPVGECDVVWPWMLNNQTGFVMCSGGDFGFTQVKEHAEARIP